jgi:2-polyprenyl-3-methyl-5-hydroxy-6-metoxy-1,4-benzoquinol methylase
LSPTAPSCRFCGTKLRHTLVDLGMSPLSNAYLTAQQLDQMEPFYPLHVRICDGCFLVQLEQYECPETIFGNYAYFSSYSESWLNHARQYAERMIHELALDSNSLVVEIASNDGYLLQFFRAQGIRVLGVEPASNVAVAAERRGIPTLVQFFGSATARELAEAGKQADLLIGNNVLAHVPDLNDFIAGLKLLLKPHGAITLEFPHLLRLIEGNQFDTIYHEHFSYFSLCTAEQIFRKHLLTVFDVEELTTHGGSLRLHIRHAEDDRLPVATRVAELKNREISAGMQDLSRFSLFAEKVQETKRCLLEFLISVKRQRKSVAGYGAPAKANTLLNFCGIGADFIDYTVDMSPHKQNRFLPGTHIPVFSPDRIRETRPDYLLILPWNLRDEIVSQMAHIREWGGRFVIPIPRAEVLS